MKKNSVAGPERFFLLAAAAVCILSAALAFLFAAPPAPEPSQEQKKPVPMIQLARVDLNTAGVEALCTLPGVGEKRARAIIENRNACGAFDTVEDAARVPGLTEEIVASWAGLAYVS